MSADEGSKGGDGKDAPHTRDPRSYTAADGGHDDSDQGSGGGGDKDDGGGKSGGGKPRKKKGPKPLTIAIMVVVAIVLLVAAIAYWLHARQFQSTDDAFVDTHLVRLAPRISGRVSKVLVEDNQEVAAGQEVIEIDSRDQEASLAQAQAQKAQAQAQIEQAQAALVQNAAQVRVAEATYTQNLAQAESSAAQATNAARDLVRYQTLKGVNAQAVSQQQLDQSQSQAQSTAASRDAANRQAEAARRQIDSTRAQAATARAQIAAGEAQVAASDAQIRSAQLQLSYTRVEAPEAGVVAQRSVALGNYVNAGAQIMAIVPLHTWVTANFKETQLAHMRAGQPVTIHVDACPDAAVTGHIDSIQHGSGQAFGLLPPENATGNFVKVVQRVPVKILIENVPPDCPLGPGLSVEPKVRVR